MKEPADFPWHVDSRVGMHVKFTHEDETNKQHPVPTTEEDRQKLALMALAFPEDGVGWLDIEGLGRCVWGGGNQSRYKFYRLE